MVECAVSYGCCVLPFFPFFFGLSNFHVKCASMVCHGVTRSCTSVHAQDWGVFGGVSWGFRLRGWCVENRHPKPTEQKGGRNNDLNRKTEDETTNNPRGTERAHPAVFSIQLSFTTLNFLVNASGLLPRTPRADVLQSCYSCLRLLSETLACLEPQNDENSNGRLTFSDDLKMIIPLPKHSQLFPNLPKTQKTGS